MLNNMFYCKIENNIISKPQRLNKLLSNILNVNKLTEDDLNDMGIYPYQEPIFDMVLQKKGDLIFDSNNNIVTNEIIDKSFDLQFEKENKIKQVQQYIYDVLSKTDRYIIRKIERGIEIPTEIAEERFFIHSESDRMKNEINNLNDVESILKYDYVLTDLQYHEV